jgi:hypothetical protein
VPVLSENFALGKTDIGVSSPTANMRSFLRKLASQFILIRDLLSYFITAFYLKLKRCFTSGVVASLDQQQYSFCII